MNSEPEVKRGQLWREVDPRFKRFIVVLSVSKGANVAMVRTLGVATGDGRPAALARFSGKRGGYHYIADGIGCSQCGEQFKQPACGPTHASIQASMR